MKRGKFKEAYLIVADVLVHCVGIEVVRILAEVDFHCAALRECLFELLERRLFRCSSVTLRDLFAGGLAGRLLWVRLLLFPLFVGIVLLRGVDCRRLVTVTFTGGVLFGGSLFQWCSLASRRHVWRRFGRCSRRSQTQTTNMTLHGKAIK